MNGTQTYRLCDAAPIAADAVARTFNIADSQGLIRLSEWEQISFLVVVDVGAGVEAVTFEVALAVEEDGDWFATSLYDLTNVGASKLLQFASVTVTADATVALFAIRDPAPFVRIQVTNTGANPATVTVWAVVV